MSHRRNPSVRRSALLSALLVLILAISGCAEVPPDVPPEALATPTVLPLEPGAGPAPEGRHGTLRVSAFPISQTDPALISSDAEVFVANHIYDYLVDVDSENLIEPRLATDWQVSDDGLTYVFALAEGVTFHDGQPFTAEDVVWTFDRLRDPASGYPTADLYAGITRIEATGDLEVTFRLSQPNPFFLYDLSDNHALVLKAEQENIASAMNGTGPFVLEEYRPEDRLVMVANDGYFRPGRPRLERLEVIFFPDQTAAVDALRGGQLDLTMDLSTPLYESLRDQPGLRTMDVATNQFAAVRLRTDREPGNDPRVVEAMRLATDRQAIFDVVQVYGAVGRDSPIGPLYDAYYTEETPLPARDPEAARELLAEAGYPEGLDIDLHLLNTLNFPDLAVVLAEQWEPAGLRVRVVTQPESIYYGEDLWLEVDLGITGWGHRPYPQFYLDVMLRCDAIWNETRFCDEEFDRLAEVAGTTASEEERAGAYAEIQRILIERGPLVVPYFFARYGAIRTEFEAFELKAFSGRTDVSTVFLLD